MSIEGSEQISAGRKWLIIFTLSLGAGLIYQLPYLRFTYYDPLQKALGLDHLIWKLNERVWACCYVYVLARWLDCRSFFQS